jgi:type VI secretion system protein ImpE
LAGEWAKAKVQLTTLAQLSPEAQMLAVVYGQAIDAELHREAVLAGTANADIHGGSEWAAPIAEAIRAVATGREDDAEALRRSAFDAAPDMPGAINGKSFDWIADADPRFGPTIEAIINGRYGLLPFDAIGELTTEGPRDLRDLVWYPVEITLKAGPRIAALLPARYPGISADSAEVMARATSWHDDGTGAGQRLLATSDGEDHGLLAVRSLRFD